MTKQSPFHPRFDQLLPAIPVFPLPGVLLLPRGMLPLNIFEPRYIAMVDAALGAGRMIGMIQPKEACALDQSPDLYRSGCAGRITSFEETDDGRYLITLMGVSRFHIAEELEMQQGFRRVRPDWTPFADDLDPPPDGALFCRNRLQKYAEIDCCAFHLHVPMASRRWCLSGTARTSAGAGELMKQTGQRFSAASVAVMPAAPTCGAGRVRSCLYPIAAGKVYFVIFASLPGHHGPHAIVDFRDGLSVHAAGEDAGSGT